MNKQAVTRKAAEATALCIKEFKDIDGRVPKCFRSNPGGQSLGEAKQKRLSGTLDSVARRNRLARLTVD